MVDVRRRCELYVALTRMLAPELAAYLMRHFEEVERNPEYQRHNRQRFEANPAVMYRLYASMGSRIGFEHVATVFEMLDPLGWAPAGGDSGG